MFLVIFQMHSNKFEVCEMCFEVFFEVSETRFVWNSLAFVRKEVFHPVWALYNIKKKAGCPSDRSPGFLCRESVGLVAASSVVPGARVPNGC